MLSSTSSSEIGAKNAARAFAALLVCLLTLALVIESGTRIAFVRASRIQSRIHGDYETAREIRPVAADGAPTVLLVGNSLVLEGVAMPLLENLTAADVQPYRYVVENTQYLDWYFALRRLFAEGTRPRRVVLGLTPNQLASRRVLGEYFGHYMMSGRDVFDTAAAAGLDSTETSNLLFANWSAWLGSKSEVRKWVAAHTIPDMNTVAGLLVGAAPEYPPLSESADLIDRRLAAVKALCEAHGARIAILLVPVRGVSSADIEVLQKGGGRTGVSILIPMGMQELPLSSYQMDGFHLNDHGADQFTRRLAIVLREWMRTSDGSSR